MFVCGAADPGFSGYLRLRSRAADRGYLVGITQTPSQSSAGGLST